MTPSPGKEGYGKRQGWQELVWSSMAHFNGMQDMLLERAESLMSHSDNITVADGM